MTIKNAMVLAAGLGTRMRPITDTIPKPLVKIAGKPMIDYALDALVEAGAEMIVVNVHHHADQMIAHLEHRSDAEILISDERAQLMNSGGGLAKGLKLLEPGPVFVMNADLFWIGEQLNAVSNLRKLAQFFDPERMDMALLCVDMDRTTGHNGKGISTFLTTVNWCGIAMATQTRWFMPAPSPWIRACLMMRRRMPSTSTSISTAPLKRPAFRDFA